MTMNTVPNGHENMNPASLVLTGKEALLVVDMLGEKMRDAKITAINANEMTAKLSQCFVMLRRYREIHSRIEEYKKVLNVKELSKEMVLTAINNGQFPVTAETFAEAEKYYTKYFTTGESPAKKPRLRKAKPTKTTEQTTNSPVASQPS